MPVKVEQTNEYLFSDIVQSQKTKSGGAYTVLDINHCLKQSISSIMRTSLAQF